MRGAIMAALNFLWLLSLLQGKESDKPIMKNIERRQMDMLISTLLTELEN
jgi:hypothetical protein